MTTVEDVKTASLQKRKPFRIRKSIRELVHKPHSHKKQRDLSLPLPALPPGQQTPEDEYVYDILYECQRGSWLVGYSSKTLLQFDPDPWCDVDMEYTPMDIHTYQLPDPTWQWVSKEWMVDMSDDVDEAGWQYALKFHGAVWHGNYKHFRSFVRRRRWIRLRHRRRGDAPSSQASIKQQETSPVRTRKLVDVDDESEVGSSSRLPPRDIKPDDDILAYLQTCRLDRERLELLERALDKPDMVDHLIPQAHALAQKLDHEASKRRFLIKLLTAKLGDLSQGNVRATLSNEEKRAIASLGFYGDVQDILNRFVTNEQ